MSIERFSFPTTIHFGAGARGSSPAPREQGMKRPLVVTDRGSRRCRSHARSSDSLRKAGLATSACSKASGATRRSQADGPGAAAFRASQGADAIVGLGGGAALDVAKAIALMVHPPGRTVARVRVGHPQVRCDRPSRIPWFVALPTTAGTGSEVGRSAVVSDDTTHVKRIVFSPSPPREGGVRRPGAHARAAGRRHGVDRAWTRSRTTSSRTCRPRYHPLCDGIALEGLAHRREERCPSPCATARTSPRAATC
jgi:alcohol dehydrogenase YqhD (iron-dependent ADH family)